jgi:hypothetical protein
MERDEMFARFFAAACVACGVSSGAHAEWYAKVEGPDVFGKTTVSAGVTGFNESLAISCDSTGSLYIALIFPKREFDKVASVPAELLLQVDGAAPVKFPAALREWNNKRGGVATSGRSPETVAMLRTIAGAKEKLNVGALVNGNQMSASFGVNGSRSAIEKTIKSCKLDDLPKS